MTSDELDRIIDDCLYGRRAPNGSHDLEDNLLV
jgi:hypothetical protein